MKALFKFGPVDLGEPWSTQILISVVVVSAADPFLKVDVRD